MSSLIITVDDTVDVVMSASPAATSLGLISYTEPAILELNEYAPDTRYLDWSTALGFRRQQTLLNFTVAPFLAANEAAADALVAGLRTSLRRIGYQTTVNRNGVVKTWRCDAGSVTPASEASKINLDRPWVTVWNVSIPCSLVSA